MFHKNALLSCIVIAAFALVIAACTSAVGLAPAATPIPQGIAIVPNTGATEVTSATTVAPTSATPASPTPTASDTPTPTLTATSTATQVPSTATATATSTATSTPVPTQTSIPVPPSGPFIQLIYPASGTTVLGGQQIVVQSTATGAAGIAHVDLWADGVLYASTANPLPGGTSMAVAQPWSPSSAGGHTLAVLAYDVLGRVSASATVIVQVPSAAAPVAWFAQPYAPSGRAVMQVGDTVQPDYWGSAGAGVARLELWVDGNLVYSDSNSTPSTMMNVQHTWSSNTIGDHSLFVRVYDELNQTTDSIPLVIGLTDRNAPNVTIVSPADHAQVSAGQTVPVSVSASDSKGITHIELWVDNLLLDSWNSAQGVGQASASISFAWTSPSVGNHTLYVIAKDSVGLSTTTQTILVNVASQTPTFMPTATATSTATPTASMTPTTTLSPTATPTVSPSPTATPTLSPTATPTVSPSPTLTATLPPTMTPTPTPSPTPTATPSLSPAATQTETH